MAYNDDKKAYTVVGKVEIGSDEFRDLIESVADYKKQSEQNRSDYWKEQTKATNAQKEAKLAKEKLQEYQDFIIDENLEKKFKEYRLAKLDEQNEEGE